MGGERRDGEGSRTGSLQRASKEYETKGGLQAGELPLSRERWNEGVQSVAQVRCSTVLMALRRGQVMLKSRLGSYTTVLGSHAIVQLLGTW
jgi:hypothetical protein